MKEERERGGEGERERGGGGGRKREENVASVARLKERKREIYT